MSIVIPKFEQSVVVRGAAAEVVGSPAAKVKLLADSSATGGALSTVQVMLEKGADGARPAPESLRDVQELYDMYFLNTQEWGQRPR